MSTVIFQLYNGSNLNWKASICHSWRVIISMGIRTRLNCSTVTCFVFVCLFPFFVLFLLNSIRTIQARFWSIYVEQTQTVEFNFALVIWIWRQLMLNMNLNRFGEISISLESWYIKCDKGQSNSMQYLLI